MPHHFFSSILEMTGFVTLKGLQRSGDQGLALAWIEASFHISNEESFAMTSTSPVTATRGYI
jgi:hypothetical protein